MTRFSTATALLALSAAASTANADIVGGFQSGPSAGAFYSGGMTYIPNINRAMFTGSHYNKIINPHGTENNRMEGEDRDVASNCYLATLDFDDEKDGETYHSLSDWISFGNPEKIETCSAVAGTKGSDVYLVGSVGDGGLFSDGYPMQGLLSIIDKETLGFIDATLIKSADDPNKHMIYPLDVIHDYHRKFVYVAALTSADATPNQITGNQDMPNWQEQHLLGSSYDVTVIKIKTPDGSKPEAIWVKHFPLNSDASGNTPPVFVAGMALQTDTNGNQHLLVSGSTRGSGEAFGKVAANSVDEDGFVMQLKLSDGSFIKHDRHEGQVFDYQDDLREGTPSDDFIRGMCNNLGRGHETHGQSDEFYIVGGTKGDMTTNSQGLQNFNGNGGFQFGAVVENKYKNSWNREESLMPFMRKVSIKTLKPIWTTQWAAMPKEANAAMVPTNAYAMDCYVDVEKKAVFVVGSVLKDAKMTQGDVEMINQGDDDIWVAKVDAETGHPFWLTQLGSTEQDYVARRGSIAVNNEGNVIIYGDTNGSLYRPRENEDPANTDMFIMTIDGTTGAVMDDIYMGGTSSGSVAETINGIPPLKPPRNPTTPSTPDTTVPNTPVVAGPTQSDSAINKESPKKGKAGTVVGIFFAFIFGLLVLYFVMDRRMKRRRAEAQKSSIFACLQQFDVEDIDLRRSPPGGWHGTYMNKLAHGQNNADDLALESSGVEGAALTHASVANDALFMDSGSGYTDNDFSIGDEDEVDARLKSSGGVV